MRSIAAALVLSSLLQAVQQLPAAPAGGSACPVSDDPTYGFTTGNPVQIGGGAMYVKAREQRYLDALRGPEGQPIRYKRLGSLPQTPNSLTIVDHYEVIYDGLESPVSLYLDAYHFWEQRAPKGFTCGRPIQLQPMMDVMKASASLQELAIEQGARRSIAPIPLEPNGGTTRGVMWDAFRMLALEAAAAAARGETLDPRRVKVAGTVILAHPLKCDDRTVLPASIEIVTAQGPAPPRTGEIAKKDGLQALLPRVEAPEGSIAAAFPLQQPRPIDRIRITYEGPACSEGTTDVTLPVIATPAKGVQMPEGTRPEGAGPDETRVLMQAVVDVDGTFARATYVGGPAKLQEAAIETLKSWRAEPARINGAPVPSSTLLEVRFR